VILFLHHRYRITGGEERVVDDLAWLVREHLGEDVDVLCRDSAQTSSARAVAGLLRGGIDPDEVGAAVRRTGARVVHAHNLNPTYGWRALAAARAAGARTVLHLHNYRLVCAVGMCFNSRGEDCTRCHGRNTLPGLRLNCRGNRGESAAYAASLALYQRRIVEHADAVVVPSASAEERLRTLGAPLGAVHVLGHLVRDFVPRSRAASGEYALIASRLAREKGIDVAIAACAQAGVPLTIAGGGLEEDELRAQAGPGVRFTGQVDADALVALRAGAALELFPTRVAETFGLSAVEAMAAGLPVVASACGALTDLAPEVELVPPGDVAALARAISACWGDQARGDAALARAREAAAPEKLARRLADVYAGA
jgi:glycosyltransferase involved in cell wall biosynthesis